MLRTRTTVISFASILALAGAALGVPPTTLTLTPNQSCYHVNDPVVVTVVLSGAPQAIVGGQFFLNFDQLHLSFVSADATAPWSHEIFESVSSNNISYAVGIPDNGAGATAGTMATLTFTATEEICNAANLVTFRTSTPPTRVADVHDVQYSAPAGTLTLNNLGAISIDSTAPILDTAASNMTVECDGSGNTAALNAWLASHGGAAAHDACSGVTWSNDYTGLSDGCGATGAATVTFTAHDGCNNTVTSTATFTIEDTTNPTLDTPAANQTVECDGSGNIAALGAWLASHGGAAAHDGCSAVTWSNDYTSLSNDCGATGSATVIFTATDDCGHSVSTSATFTIEDTLAPTLDTPAADQTVECDGSGNTAALNAWLASHGGATAHDGCSPVTWSNDYTGLSNDCGATGSAMVTFTATDDCGHSVSTTATFAIEDTQAPTLDTPASNQTVECDGSGNTAALNAWLASHGGAAAHDNCSSVTWSNDFAGLTNGCGATGSTLVTFTAIDDCGHSVSTSATFAIEDTTAPIITTPAANMTVECDGSGNTAALAAWLASNGGAAAHDDCSSVSWSNDFTALSNGCGATGSATVTFTVTDECMHSSTTIATFTIEDTTPPVITTAASDLTVECDGSGNAAALAAWLASNGGAAAHDDCSSVSWSNDFTALSNGCGATGSATVTFTVTDECLHSSSTTATFTIEDTTPPAITTAASDLTVECDGSGNAAALAAWLASNGGAAAHDDCSSVTWSNDYTALSNDCGATGSVTVTFTATDECLHSSTTVATFTIEDTTAPTLDTPASNQTVECDGSGNTAALNAWLASHGGAAAHDTCSGVTWSNNYTGLSDGCGATGSATVTFTASDDCGHSVSTSATFTIEDTVAPTLDAPASNQTVECDGSGNTAALNAWLASHGGAAAHDGCSAVTWSNDYTSLSNDCGATGSATVTFTASDDCGHSVSTSATFTIEDTTPPTLDTAASDQTVECDGSGNTAALNAWLASHGGATAHDACSSVTWANDYTGLSNDCGATGSATVTFTATDDCGHSVGTIATFTIEDTTAPTLDTAASDQTVECDGAGNTASLNAWLASHGGAAAHDNCSNVTWSNNYTGLSDGCGATGSATVTFTATDDCGHSVDTIATFTIEDTTDPTITAPADISVNADAGHCYAVVNPGTPSAHDDCGGVTVSFTRSDGATHLTDPYLTGTTTITWTATDGCGHTASDTQDIIVSGYNELVLNVQLSGVNQPSLTRCIQFELYTCGPNTTYEINTDVTFTAGLKTGLHLLVPCGTYSCMTATDVQHTLRRTDGAFGIVGTQYVADFTTTGLDGDNSLIGGNFNNDDYIDILDFGIFVNRFGHNYGTGDTHCPVTGYNADGTGDGLVDTSDFSFIQINFLRSREANCCGLNTLLGQPITQISVSALRAAGLGELAIADLNRDDMLDEQDISAWINGVRPVHVQVAPAGEAEVDEAAPAPIAEPAPAPVAEEP